MDEVRSWLAQNLDPVMRAWGFKEEQGNVSTVWTRRRSFWPIAFVSLLAFPLGPRMEDVVVIGIDAFVTGLRGSGW